MRPLLIVCVAAVMWRPGTEGAITVTLPPQGGQTESPVSDSPGVDPVLALRAQRYNLLLLFQRYGENNQSLNMTGFRQLLRSLGEERLKSIAIQTTDRHHHHHQNRDHHHHHHQHHHHQHNHNHHQHHHHGHSTEHSPCEERRQRRHVTSPATGHRTHSRVSLAAEVECLNASRLLTLHGMDMQMLLDADAFGYICPAIINQIDRKSCLVNAPEEAMAEGSHGVYSVKVAWVGGFISITVISVLSLLGIILVPLMNKVFFKFLLSFLVALAVGTLSGDAFLHLLPHSHAKHYHSHGGLVNESHADEKAEESAHLDATLKGLTALGGLYFMFLVEHLLTLIKQYKDKKQKMLLNTWMSITIFR